MFSHFEMLQIQHAMEAQIKRYERDYKKVAIILSDEQTEAAKRLMEANYKALEKINTINAEYELKKAASTENIFD